MSLAENMDLWMVAERNEALREGEARGLENGRREGEARGEARGEQRGLNQGRREAVMLALELKFGELGLRFWEDHFAHQPLGPWEELLDGIKRARSLDDLHPHRPHR